MNLNDVQHNLTHLTHLTRLMTSATCWCAHLIGIFVTGVLTCSALNAQTPAQTAAQTAAQALAQTQKSTHAAPHRVITLAPHLAHLAHAAGAAAYVVGVSDYTLPQFAAQHPSVGNAFAINWQHIAVLKPTLALVWGSGTPATVKAKLKALNIALFESEPTSLAGIVGETQQLAQRLNLPANNPALTVLQSQFAQLGMPPKTTQWAVFHPIWPRPLMTVNGQHVISDALRYCGARNVFAHAKGLSPTVTFQQVLREKPDRIIIAQSSSEPQLKVQWQPLLAAFPKGLAPAVITVNGDYFHQPGPGLITETLLLCKALQSAQ